MPASRELVLSWEGWPENQSNAKRLLGFVMGNGKWIHGTVTRTSLSMAVSPDRVLTVAFACFLLASSLLLASATVSFIATHDAAWRTATIPLVTFFGALGIYRWRWQLTLFVFLTPLLYWLPTSEEGMRLSLVRMLFPFLLLPWSCRLLLTPCEVLPSHPLRSPLLCYCAVVLLSTVLSVWRYFPIVRWSTLEMIWFELVEANRVSFWAYSRPQFSIVNETLVYLGLPIFVLLLLHSADRRLLRSLRVALLGSAVLASVVAAGEYFLGVESAPLATWGRPNLRRLSGTLGDPNTFGAFLSAVSGMALAWSLLVWRSPEGFRIDGWRMWGSRALNVLVLAIIGFALIGTRSRAAWLGAFVGSVFLLLRSSRSPGHRSDPSGMPWSRLLLSAFLSLSFASLFYIGTLFWKPYSQWTSGWDVFWSLFTVDVLSTELWTRWHWWRPALQMGAAVLPTGVGVGCYRYFVDPYSPGSGKSGILAEPHNYYLKVFSELGLPGVLLFFLAIWVTVRCCSRRATESRSEFLQILGAQAGLMAVAIGMLFQHSLAQIEMQIVSGLVLVLALPCGTSSVVSRPSSAGVRRALGIVVASSIATIVAFGSYRTPAPVVVPASSAEASGRVRFEDADACLGRGGGLNVDLDLPLGRALVLVAARGWRSGGELPMLVLLMNGRVEASWPTSVTQETFMAPIFVREGKNRLQLRYSSVGDPDTTAKCSVSVLRISALTGHDAVRHMFAVQPELVEESILRANVKSVPRN